MSNSYVYKQRGKTIRVIDSEDGYEWFKVYTTPYKMRMDDLDIEAVCDKIYPARERMVFYDGYAINTSKDCLITYKTIEEIKALKNPDWYGADIYEDGSINFFQIQFRYHNKTIVGKEKVQAYLKKHNITL